MYMFIYIHVACASLAWGGPPLPRDRGILQPEDALCNQMANFATRVKMSSKMNARSKRNPRRFWARHTLRIYLLALDCGIKLVAKFALLVKTASCLRKPSQMSLFHLALNFCNGCDIFLYWFSGIPGPFPKVLLCGCTSLLF